MRRTRLLPRVLWLLLALASAALVAVTFLPSDDGFKIIVPFVLGVTTTFGVVGIVVISRQPRNLVGWMLYLMGITLATVLAGQAYASYSVLTAGGTLPGTVAATYWANVTIIPVIGSLCAFVPLLFPDGHLPSPRWRARAWLSVCLLAAGGLVQAFLPGPLNGSQIENPVGIPALAVFGASGFGLFIPMCLAVPMLIGIGATVTRYRHGDTVVRQQLRWFGSAAVALFVALVVGSLPVPPLDQVGWLVIVLATVFLPIAIGVAITRYRLYEIDRLISRTIGWAVVTGLLLGLFVATILALQALLSPFTSGSSVAAAASTLVVLALFQPVARRVRRRVDRRFNRAHYDAERTAAAFAERLRDEVDLGAVAADLTTTASTVLVPARIGLWLREPGAGR